MFATHQTRLEGRFFAAIAPCSLLLAWGCAGGAHVGAHVGATPDVRQIDAHTLRGARSFLTGWPAQAGAGLIHVVVEIPAGDVQKWEVSKPDGALRWEMKAGKPRVIPFVGYPGNYGMVPRTLLPKSAGGDGDPLDVLVLGPPRPRGTVLKVRPIGVLRLLDRGEIDDKIIAVDAEGSFSAFTDMPQLQQQRPGVTRIVELFFGNYKGPGKLITKGFGGAEVALKMVALSANAFERAHRKP